VFIFLVTVDRGSGFGRLDAAVFCGDGGEFTIREREFRGALGSDCWLETAQRYNRIFRVGRLGDGGRRLNHLRINAQSGMRDNVAIDESVFIIVSTDHETTCDEMRVHDFDYQYDDVLHTKDQRASSNCAIP
jgi:hypothetical protein